MRIAAMTGIRFSWMRVSSAGISVFTYPPPSWATMSGTAVSATYCIGTYTHTFRLYGTTLGCFLAMPG